MFLTVLLVSELGDLDIASTPIPPSAPSSSSSGNKGSADAAASVDNNNTIIPVYFLQVID